MINKKVIIDGVNVSDCIHRDEISSNCLEKESICQGYNHCDHYKQCYYKNWQRKEQECEELKEKYLELKEQNGSFIVQLNTANEQLDQLKAENRELKAVHSTNVALSDELFKYKAEIEELKKINKANAKSYEKHWYKLEKYKQTLTEIKEILQFYNNTTIGIDKGNGFFEFEVSNDNVLGGKLICCYDTNPAKQALQKISECEVNNG